MILTIKSLEAVILKKYHNFIRKEVKDKKTPAERCGISLNGNKWNTLLLNLINNIDEN